MAEYIDREVFKKSIEEHYCLPCKEVGKDYNGCRCRACWVDDMLDEVDCFQPTADVAPVVHGRWIMVDDSCGKYACSACREIEQECTEWGAGHYNPVDKDYCPNCGAKMDEKEG